MNFFDDPITQVTSISGKTEDVSVKASVMLTKDMHTPTRVWHPLNRLVREAGIQRDLLIFKRIDVFAQKVDKTSAQRPNGVVALRVWQSRGVLYVDEYASPRMRVGIFVEYSS